MPQATIPGSQPLSDENQEHRNAREIAQARLEWQTRAGNSLSLTVRWRRFYQTRQVDRQMLLWTVMNCTERITELRQMTNNPDPWVTAGTWTQAMEKLENLEAELSAVRACLRGGGSE